MPNLSDISRGLILMAFGMVMMSIMDAIVKHLTDSISAPQILFFRSFFGLLPLLIIAWRKGGRRAVYTRKPLVHMVRAGLAAVAFVCFTIGLREMSLANALAISFAAPFFAVCFSVLLMGERVGFHRIFALLAGFGGVVIVLQPDDGILGDGSGYFLLVAVTYALAQVIARKYRETETGLSFSFWTMTGMTILGAVSMLFYWEEMTLEIWGWAFAMGIFGGLAAYCMTEAVRAAPTVVVSPMEYTALIWGALFDWMFWQVFPEQATIIGSLVIVASGIYILWRERSYKEEIKIL
ncbi:membrane protein [Terasakiella brassicae]|uniref:Membrane protein n=1 Tax=Terasakiella brassicae TaxID=1634917 RepID=A0A917FEM2_9PROT|nr:DMT family transporter [Terasakiella brassicae]GGF68226.1 membrane protein [Terasakiella brassicae]